MGIIWPYIEMRWNDILKWEISTLKNYGVIYHANDSKWIWGKSRTNLPHVLKNDLNKYYTVNMVSMPPPK